MKELTQEEQKIFDSFKPNLSDLVQLPDKDLKEKLSSEIKKSNYLGEDWQVHYSVEAIKEKIKTTIKLETTYKGLTEEQIEYIESWSWGAFFGGLIWPVFSRVGLWWIIGWLVPFLNIYVWIKLSLHGKKISWQKWNWGSFEKFQKRQQLLGTIIAIFIGVSIAIQLIIFILLN